MIAPPLEPEPEPEPKKVEDLRQKLIKKKNKKNRKGKGKKGKAATASNADAAPSADITKKTVKKPSHPLSPFVIPKKESSSDCVVVGTVAPSVRPASPIVAPTAPPTPLLGVVRPFGQVRPSRGNHPRMNFRSQNWSHFPHNARYAQPMFPTFPDQVSPGYPGMSYAQMDQIAREGMQRAHAYYGPLILPHHFPRGPRL